MSRVVISQPMLFPWPGFFEQLMLADEYIYLDDTQFSKGSFTNRIQLLQRGERSWMTIPLVGKGSFQKISELESAGDAWRSKHRSLLLSSLADAPYLDVALSLFDSVYAKSSLLDLLIASIEEPASYMQIGSRRSIKRSSDMNVGGVSSRRVLDIVHKARGDCYITGHGASRYLDHVAFENEGVQVEYMTYSLTPWERSGMPCTPYLSILDLIAHTGPRASTYLCPSTVSWQKFLKEETTTS